jgi:hypothetical protein
MRKGLLIALLALGVVATAAAGNLPKKSVKPKYQAKADTTFNIKSDDFGSFTSIENMMKEMHKQSRSFMNDAMAMLDNMPMSNFSFPANVDSIVKGMERDEFVDSLGNSKHHRHRNMAVRPRMHEKQLRFKADSLGKNESIVVLSDGKKTTIIKNGKDTTIVDGPMDGILDDFDFNMDMPTIRRNMPRFNFRGYGNDDLNAIVRHPFSEGRFAPETPSVQEMDLLVKKGIISAKEAKNNLKVEDVNIIPSGRSNTYSVVFSLEGIEQCELQVVTPDGMTLEKSTIIGNEGRFRRTVKITPNQDYVFVVVSSDKKTYVSKFWF